MNAYVVPEKTEKQMPQMLVMFCTNWDWSFARMSRNEELKFGSTPRRPKYLQSTQTNIATDSASDHQTQLTNNCLLS